MGETRLGSGRGESSQDTAIERLYAAVQEHRQRDPAVSRTARLFDAGRERMARKLGEEAIEVAIDAMRGRRDNVIAETADLLYHLVVLWAEMGIAPAEVWAELTRRESAYGIAEKIPKKKS
jgi:phosphoribosyl-ATP pyrophosphohydrolase